MNKHILMSIFVLCATPALDAGKGCSSCPKPQPAKPAKPVQKAPVRTVAAPTPAPVSAPVKKTPTFKTGQLHKFEDLRTRRDDQDTLSKIKQHPFVILDFHRERSCPPCRMLAPVLEELARERNDVLIVKINADEDPIIFQQAGVRSVPTMHFYKNGSQVKTEVGFKDKAAMHNMLNSTFGKKSA